MKKILIIGSSGAGKSTLSKKLSEKTGIKIIHLDKIYWKPNWTEPEKDEWKELLEKVMREDEAWIMDGNFGGTLDLRLKACDTAIFLDFPRITCFYRVIKRRLTYNKANRPDMAEGCAEKIDLKFLDWIWNFQKVKKPKIEEKLRHFENEKMIIRLRSKKEVEAFLLNYSR